MRIGKRAAALAVLPMLAGCATPRVESTSSPTALRLGKPDRVIVSPFIALARNGASNVTRPVEQEPVNPAELRAARDAQAALQAALVTRLREAGLPVEAGGSESAQGTTMLVQGQIVSLTEGSRTRRPLLGLGSGQGPITAEVQLLYVAGNAAPQFLESFEAEAPTTPVATTNAEINRVADAMAKRIVAFAAAQGWVPAAR